jgi:hypothetical protein
MPRPLPCQIVQTPCGKSGEVISFGKLHACQHHCRDQGVSTQAPSCYASVSPGFTGGHDVPCEVRLCSFFLCGTLCYGLSNFSGSDLHGAMAPICDAALLRHAVARRDTLGGNLTDVFGGAGLLAERQVHRRLVVSNRTCAAPSIGTCLLDDYLLRSCTQAGLSEKVSRYCHAARVLRLPRIKRKSSVVL